DHVIITIAGNGTAGYSGDGGTATAAALNSPFGIRIGSAGNLLIADSGNSAIRKVSNGIISTVAGNGTVGYSGDGGPAASARLNGPVDVATDTFGHVYIADSVEDVVRKLTPQYLL